MKKYRVQVENKNTYQIVTKEVSANNPNHAESIAIDECAKELNLHQDNFDIIVCVPMIEFVATEIKDLKKGDIFFFNHEHFEVKRKFQEVKNDKERPLIAIRKSDNGEHRFYYEGLEILKQVI